MPADADWVQERDRLARAYAERAVRVGSDAVAWSWLRPEAHWLDVMAQMFLLRGLRQAGWRVEPSGARRLLEVGCGTGRVLRWCYDAGVRHLHGVELLRARAAEAHAAVPGARIIHATMGRLPYRSGTFDCVIQFVTFSSCLEVELRRAAAREMLRVLRDDGCIVWCDLTTAHGSYVQPIVRRDLQALFPGTRMTLHHFGVHPQWLGALTSLLHQGVLRTIVRRTSWGRQWRWAQPRPVTAVPLLLAALLERCPGATCYLGAIIRKRPAAGSR